MMLFLTGLLAFYLAFNLGANDVANSMGTSVGSKAVTLRQALIIAGVLEFSGAVLFGHNVSQTLVTDIVNPELFVQASQIFLVGMTAVLIACGIWLNVATAFGLPVSSSHATVGAIAGFGWVAAGVQAVNWGSIGIISLTWIVTPLISGVIAACFYYLIKHWILEQPDPLAQLQEWIPWLSALLFGCFGAIVLPTLSLPLQRFIASQTGFMLPRQDIPLAIGAIATLGLTLFSWKQLKRKVSQENAAPDASGSIESHFARFQVLSACFVAFAHGSNDVGNAIAPLAAIRFIQKTGAVPLDTLEIPFWILGLGGFGIVVGLAILGKRVITTIGENIVALQPSSGFCAELATATTVLIASQLGLPVSTSHALVGGVVGVGLLHNRRSVQLETLKNIGLAWGVTLPVAAFLGIVFFQLLRMWI